MVKEMADTFRKGWTPDPDHFVVEEEDDEVNEPVVIEFIVKPPFRKRLFSHLIFVATFLIAGSVMKPRSVAG